MNNIYYFFIFLIVTTISNAQTLNYYFGNLHSHSKYSDGNQDNACSNTTCCYSYAQASAHFDFLGISDHNHSSAGMNIADYHQGYIEAQNANQEGVFLCLYGMEWGVTTNSTDGHVIIYGFGNQLIGWESGNFDIYVAKSDYDALFKLVKNTPNAFCYLAHPGYNDFQYLSSNPHNSAYDSAIVAVPFRSGYAFSTNTSYSDYPSGNYFNYYRILLSKGYKIGIGYDHDNHYTTFGRNNAGRLVVLAPSLTTANLFAAMKNMHFYGSDDWNAQIDFKINNTEIMGNIVTSSLTPTITVVHNDGDGETADSIKIWAGISGSGTYPTVIKTINNSNLLTYVDTFLANGTQTYYFVEIIQQDGQRIITSPIWYTKDPLANISTINNTQPSVLIFPNPIIDNLHISTSEKNYTVKVYDILNHLIMQKNSKTENIAIDFQPYPSGIYFIQIEKNNQVIYYQKIIK